MTHIRELLHRQHELDKEVRRKIESNFGRKGRSALDAIDAGRVKKYLDFFVVEGRTASYIVEDNFCTCGDFLFRGRACWHLLAVQIAQETGRCVAVDQWYQETIRDTEGK